MARCTWSAKTSSTRTACALFGGSYGGYAALQDWRATRTSEVQPRLRKAVTDIELKQTVTWSDTARYSDYYQTDFKRWIGELPADRARFDATSPAKNADKIKVAVMLTMGGQDIAVKPLIHGKPPSVMPWRKGKPPTTRSTPTRGMAPQRARRTCDRLLRPDRAVLCPIHRQTLVSRPRERTQ